MIWFHMGTLLTRVMLRRKEEREQLYLFSRGAVFAIENARGACKGNEDIYQYISFIWSSCAVYTGNEDGLIDVYSSNCKSGNELEKGREGGREGGRFIYNREVSHECSGTPRRTLTRISWPKQWSASCAICLLR